MSHERQPTHPRPSRGEHEAFYGHLGALARVVALTTSVAAVVVVVLIVVVALL